jgi:hypothetical protein
MWRGIICGVAVAVLGIAAFAIFFKRDAAADREDARDFPRATSPQDCVDRFRAAVRERKYHMTARYCTRDYGDQLSRGAQPAHDLGAAIDDLTQQLRTAGLLTTELEYTLFLHDPLPPELTLTLQSVSDKEATATIGSDNPALFSPPYRTWRHDAWFVKAFYADHPRDTVRLIQQDGHWFIDVPVSSEMRSRVERLVRNHRHYVNALQRMSNEVRSGQTAEVATRLELLLTEAMASSK